MLVGYIFWKLELGKFIGKWKESKHGKGSSSVIQTHDQDNHEYALHWIHNAAA